MKIFNAIGQLISSPLFAVAFCMVGGIGIWRYSTQLAEAVAWEKPDTRQGTVAQTVVAGESNRFGTNARTPPKPTKPENQRSHLSGLW